MHISLIAALAEDLVIGSVSGKIPWDLPRDRAHFRDRTAGRWLLLGRNTYLEMEGWFGDRTPIVLTGDSSFRPFKRGHRTAPSTAAALDLARDSGVSELLVCGGARVYAAMLPLADRLLLTRIDLRPRVPDPVHFPAFDAPGDWHLRYRECWPGSNGHPEAHFEVHERVAKRSLALSPLPV